VLAKLSIHPARRVIKEALPCTRICAASAPHHGLNHTVWSQLDSSAVAFPLSLAHLFLDENEQEIVIKLMPKLHVSGRRGLATYLVYVSPLPMTFLRIFKDVGAARRYDSICSVRSTCTHAVQASFSSCRCVHDLSLIANRPCPLRLFLILPGCLCDLQSSSLVQS